VQVLLRALQSSSLPPVRLHWASCEASGFSSPFAMAAGSPRGAFWVHLCRCCFWATPCDRIFLLRQNPKLRGLRTAVVSHCRPLETQCGEQNRAHAGKISRPSAREAWLQTHRRGRRASKLDESPSTRSTGAATSAPRACFEVQSQCMYPSLHVPACQKPSLQRCQPSMQLIGPGRGLKHRSRCTGGRGHRRGLGRGGLATRGLAK